MTTTTKTKPTRTKPAINYVVYAGSHMGVIPAVGEAKFIGKGCAIEVNDITRGRIEQWVREGYFRALDEEEFDSLPYCSCGVRFSFPMAQARHVKAHSNETFGPGAQHFVSNLEERSKAASEAAKASRATSKKLKASIDRLRAGATADGVVVIDPKTPPALPAKDDDDEDDEFGLG